MLNSIKFLKSLSNTGFFWPVNAWSVARIGRLFAVNERITTVIKSEFGLVGVVKVGATNVGAIKLSYDDVIANQHPKFINCSGKVEHREYSPGTVVKRGDEIGVFQMGSTVILLFERGRFSLSRTIAEDEKKFLKMGERIQT